MCIGGGGGSKPAALPEAPKMPDTSSKISMQDDNRRRASRGQRGTILTSTQGSSTLNPENGKTLLGQ